MRTLRGIYPIGHDSNSQEIYSEIESGAAEYLSLTDLLEKCPSYSTNDSFRTDWDLHPYFTTKKLTISRGVAS